MNSPATLDAERLQELASLPVDNLLAQDLLGDLVRAAGCDGLAGLLALALEDDDG